MVAGVSEIEDQNCPDALRTPQNRYAAGGEGRKDSRLRCRPGNLAALGPPGSRIKS